ncbi:MAG: DUF1640 domain-containing protein [Magnetococcales bacterium]|nr:DUF1640 domain-containing protein [Magnetococcales bacterium]
MSHAVTFDTLKFVKRLKEAGFSEPQAEAQTELLAEALAERLASKEDVAALDGKIEIRVAELKRDIKEVEATLKRDIKEFEATLKRDIKEFEATLKRDVKELELRMVIKLGGLIVVGVGLVATANRLWPSPVQYVNPPAQEMRQALSQEPRQPAIPSQ